MSAIERKMAAYSSKVQIIVQPDRESNLPKYLTDRYNHGCWDWSSVEGTMRNVYEHESQSITE